MATSRSRLSTYMSGKVVPSAALMVRMRRVALQAAELAIRDASQAFTRGVSPPPAVTTAEVPAWMVDVGQCGREVATVEGWRPVEELIQWGFARAPVVMANEAEQADPADRGPETAARRDSR